MSDTEIELPEALPDDVPVHMPDLPLSLDVDTPQQMKALADPVRQRIVGIIQNRPATAKQIADRLKIPPGTIGHHLQVLEAAGLAKVVARRVVRGIVAKYYTRTARIYSYKFPRDVTGEVSSGVSFVGSARDELAEAFIEGGPDLPAKTAFPHTRLTPERQEYFMRRVNELVDEFIAEPFHEGALVFGLSVAFFQAPMYLQDSPASGIISESGPEVAPEDERSSRGGAE
jgi:DNA-binding transcriptional ArsR family regulator